MYTTFVPHTQIIWGLSTFVSSFASYMHTCSFMCHYLSISDPEQYISFGISGKRDRTTMEHADVAVAYYDKKISLIVLKDYFLESRAQCSTNGGVCPDEHNGGRNDLTLISSEYRNGIIEVVYSRPLATSRWISN